MKPGGFSRSRPGPTWVRNHSESAYWKGVSLNGELDGARSAGGARVFTAVDILVLNLQGKRVEELPLIGWTEPLLAHEMQGHGTLRSSAVDTPHEMVQRNCRRGR